MGYRKLKYPFQYYMPNKKRPFTGCCLGSASLLDALCRENQNATVEEIKELINYDVDAKRVCDDFILKGFENEKQAFLIISAEERKARKMALAMKLVMSLPQDDKYIYEE